jgi:hypothetical protein
VRLRREFQNITFLTPIELEHAILISEDHSKQNLRDILLKWGYPEEEILRAEQVSLELGYIMFNNGQFEILTERLPIARRLLLLDIAASNAKKITDEERCSAKYLLIPGYGANMGILESELSELVCSIVKTIQISPVDFTRDIEWLLDQGSIKRR